MTQNEKDVLKDTLFETYDYLLRRGVKDIETQEEQDKQTRVYVQLIIALKTFKLSKDFLDYEDELEEKDND